MEDLGVDHDSIQIGDFLTHQEALDFFNEAIADEYKEDQVYITSEITSDDEYADLPVDSLTYHEWYTPRLGVTHWDKLVD